MTIDWQMRHRREGKSLIAVEAAKMAQRQGKKVLFATADQAATAERLSKHGALSEIVGTDFVAPHFREASGD